MTPPKPRPSLTEGSIARSTFALALPTMGGLFMQAAFNIVDIFWVGRLGGEALAAVSVAGFVVWMLLALARMATVGVTALVARRVGEGDEAGAARQAWQGIGLALLSAAVVGAAFYAARGPLFRFMRTSPEVTALGESYLTVILAGLPAVFLFFVLGAVSKGAGDARTPMKILGLALALNAALDPVLIFGWFGFPAMGVAGAGLATVAAKTMGCVAAFVWLPPFVHVHARGKVRRMLVPDPGLYRKILKIGVPLSASGALFCVVYLFLTRITTHFGVAFVAALGICHKIESIGYFTHMGFSEAAATLVGQNLGAGKPERAEACAWASARWAAYLSAGIAAAFFVWADALVGIFTDDPAIVAAGAVYLRIVALPQIFQAYDLVLEGAFGGAGDTLPPTLIAIPVTFLRIPIAHVLSFHLLDSGVGVWWAIGATMTLNGVLMTLWFRRGGWKRRTL
jgi:putative MATE family efflux protein